MIPGLLEVARGGERWRRGLTRDTCRVLFARAPVLFFGVSLIPYNSHHNSRAQSRETVPASRR